MKSIKEVETYWAEICCAGDYHHGMKICQKYCDVMGLCITIEKCVYVYTSGNEDGMKVRLINYPRFPSDEKTILRKTKKLALILLQHLKQETILIITSSKTIWFNNRYEE